MVRLDRIYTKGGDEGLTSLGDGTRVAKHDPRVVAFAQRVVKMRDGRIDDNGAPGVN